ncbi:MAG: OmpH family outer membrane protein [Alphaproteobacteria bacterium]|nr:MAG: OmpH family outer membrane protein [Alphaproteobacteria bacterium]
MKRLFSRMLLMAAFAAFTFASIMPAASWAQQAPNSVIIVVDFARVNRESLAGKDITNQLEAHAVKLQNRAKQLSDELQKEQESIVKQRELVAQDVFQNMVTQFQKKRENAEGEIEEKNKQRQLALRQASAELENALRPIIRQLMQEKKANLVLDKNVVFDQLDGLDVTTQVIERLNKQLPSLKVSLPE